MARKLKTYQTSLGFFEQAIAAPSMKAALEAWGADSNLFHSSTKRKLPWTPRRRSTRNVRKRSVPRSRGSRRS
jgi:hypothetical protein